MRRELCCGYMGGEGDAVLKKGATECAYLLFWATWPPQVRTDGRTVGRSRDRTDGRTGHVFGRTPHMFGRTPHVFGRTPPLTEGVPWGVGCFFAPTPPQNPPSPMACSRPDGRVGRTVWTDGFLDGRFGRTVWTDGLLDGRFGKALFLGGCAKYVGGWAWVDTSCYWADRRFFWGAFCPSIYMY